MHQMELCGCGKDMEGHWFVERGAAVGTVCSKRGMPLVTAKEVRRPRTSGNSCRRETSVKIWGFKPSANMFVTTY